MTSLFTQWGLAMLVALPFYLILRRPWRFAWRREVALGCFVLLIAGLIGVVLHGNYQTPSLMIQDAMQRLKTHDQMNFVPLRTVKLYLNQTDLEPFFINIVGNVVMFMPWGFGLVLLWKKNNAIWRMVLFSLALTVCIECAQLFIGRFVDIDDILLNFIGSMLGALLCRLLKRKISAIDRLAK